MSSRGSTGVVLLTLALSLCGPVAADPGPGDLSVAVKARVQECEALLRRLAQALSRDDVDPELAGAWLRRTLDHQGRLATRAIPRDLEVEAARRFFGDGFFMPEDDTPELRQRARALLDELRGVAFRIPGPIDVRVLSGGSLMAFGKGGDIVIVTDEILDLPRGEALAVLVHEVAHLEARDYLRQRVAGALLARLGQLVPPERKAALAELGRRVLNEASHEAEFAADRRAAEVLAGTRFGAGAVASMLSRLTGNGGDASDSDHPTIEARLRNLEATGTRGGSS